MKSAWFVVSLLVGGTTVMSCGGSASSAPATTAAHTSTYTGSALSWVSTHVRPWNEKLNTDQKIVYGDAAATSEAGSNAFFARLASACTRLADDARAAGHVQTAPTASLAAAWRGMTAHTEEYAAACLALTRGRSNADLTRWDNSLESLDLASATLNTAVAAVRNGTSG